ncbi:MULTISPECIES: response regulator [unclassified Gilliamella]|uniref:response regulator n=1 Tax=unclassified Gilliamella TaxID=2685620 RepID=UPI00080ECDC4|nr:MULTISPECIES: response regulator [Gilliamella]MCX8641430.1 response regulator [Gilliamella sp. B3835]MCX8707540.1 response regulator [Gilliamella sp. B3783]MCX8710620.1 response regulator [Gilliamella sp. B3780]MCX8711208.1 response regulator [Gilliamella sp. B3468]MCX8714735.1 response regulator [Gilliamella sp. B3781]
MQENKEDAIKVLIVEDEPILAELNADFIQRDTKVKVVGIASNLEEAKKMVEKLKPTLILLDNYLPDGKGIELFEYIINNNLNCYVIFITAASDMDTCSKAIRYGAFDYLIKPVSYQRLKHSLARFELFLYRQSLQKHVNQRRIDELFNLQTKDFVDINRHSKGIEEITLQKVKDLFMHTDTPQTVDEIVEKAKISKTTARRYLEYCVQTKVLTVELNHGKIGRPERLYKRLGK